MRFSIRSDRLTGERYMAVHVKGKELLLDPLLNNGTAGALQPWLGMRRRDL